VQVTPDNLRGHKEDEGVAIFLDSMLRFPRTRKVARAVGLMGKKRNHMQMILLVITKEK